MTPDEYEEALDALMRRILRRMELLSDGKASSPGMSAGGADGNEKGSSTIAQPKGAAPSPILRLGPQDWGWDIRSLKNRYGRARDMRVKRELIAEALKLLTFARYAPQRSERRGTKEWREKIAHDPHTPSEIALLFGVSRPTVYKCRKEFKSNGNGSIAA